MVEAVVARAVRELALCSSLTSLPAANLGRACRRPNSVAPAGG